MKPLRPYMFNGFYNWCAENNGNCHVTLQTDWPGVNVPPQFYKDKLLTLCIRPDAVVNWFACEDSISFTTRFNGQPFPVFIPMGAVMQLYDKVTGTTFPMAPEPEYIEQFQKASAPPPKGKPTLTVVK